MSAPTQKLTHHQMLEQAWQYWRQARDCGEWCANECVWSEAIDVLLDRMPRTA